MKVSTTDFKNAILLFEASLIEQTNDLTNKSALAIGFKNKANDINNAVDSYAKDGMVDIDEMRELIGAGIKGGGGKLVLKPDIPAWARGLGVTIKDITITAAEADDFFDKIVPQVSPSAIE